MMQASRRRWPGDRRRLVERKTKDEIERDRRALRDKAVAAIIEAGNARGRAYRETWSEAMQRRWKVR